jgi:hypothetical protein
MSRRLAIIAATFAIVVTACGRNAPVPPPTKVQTELVPSSLLNGSLRVAGDDKTSEVFKRPAPRGLVADGKVFTIRGAGDRLVGTLQLSTVRHDVDLTKSEARNRLVDGILPTSERITVGTLEVAQSNTTDKTVYVWFSKGQFQVLQLKPTTAVPFEPDELLAELIGYETQQPTWKPVRAAGIDTTNGEEEDPG